MFGQLSHELEVNVPASEAWELYSTLQLAKLVEEEPPSGIEKVDVIEGDGGAGTILKLTFAGITKQLKLIDGTHERLVEASRCN
ncbi:hypothetical protein SO802_014412 [Lithocarpus litseifolius]|uniref:Bet v I/Major latex protein domain-containing protein n=1 Tax=Lithocarpus litseifolius TaxID=425828 RepID=A0AAW2CUE8_9ROSI